jgi:hypothetical protein
MWYIGTNSLPTRSAEAREVVRGPKDLGRIPGPIVINNGIEVVQLRDLRTANMPFVASTGGATVGTGVATALPPGVALVISERTAQAGRGFRGRIYLPGLDSSAVTAATGAASAAANTAAVNFITAVQTALTGQGITLAIANPARQAYTGRTLRAIPARAAGMITVTSIVARLTALTSQRRRSYVA